MRVGVVGINHKIASLDLRERLAKACDRHFSPTNLFHGEHRFLLLSTCNRTEVYFSSEDLPATHSYLLSILRGEVNLAFEHKLYSYFGQDCFYHLSKVTAGIDSAITGETEIQGQVKKAYETRSQFSDLPHDLHFLFQKSLKIGKQIRSTFQLGRGMPNIEHVLFSTGLHFFGDRIWSLPTLLVGASEINQKICIFLQQRGMKNLTMINRSDCRTKTFAEKYQIQMVPWKQLDSWTDYKWVIVGTKATETILHFKDGSPHYPRLIIDLSVPRNVDPRLGKKHCPKSKETIALYNIDQMNRNVIRREQQLKKTLQLAEHHTVDQVNRLTQTFIKNRNPKKHWNTFQLEQSVLNNQ